MLEENRDEKEGRQTKEGREREREGLAPRVAWKRRKGGKQRRMTLKNRPVCLLGVSDDHLLQDLARDFEKEEVEEGGRKRAGERERQRERENEKTLVERKRQNPLSLQVRDVEMVYTPSCPHTHACRYARRRRDDMLFTETCESVCV